MPNKKSDFCFTEHPNMQAATADCQSIGITYIKHLNVYSVRVGDLINDTNCISWVKQ